MSANFFLFIFLYIGFIKQLKRVRSGIILAMQSTRVLSFQLSRLPSIDKYCTARCPVADLLHFPHARARIF